MTNRWNTSAQRGEVGDAAERARVREAQHATLADLLGAYADGELPPESAARVDAHLVGCTRCRRDLATQTALRDRLAAEVVLPASPSLRDRIIASTANVPPAAALLASLSEPVGGATLGTDAPAPLVHPPWYARRWRVAAATAFAVAAVAGTAVRWHGRPMVRDAAAVVLSSPTPAGEVSLLAAALADYRRVSSGDLPGRARDLDAVRAAVGFPVEPLRAPGLRLLAAWTTTLDGEATAVLAYRRADRLVLEYRVSESLFFRHAALRSAAAAHRVFASVDGAQTVLAWPDATSAVLLVSDDTPAQLMTSLPPLLFAAPVPRPAPAGAAGAP